jgi:hypothetical protein
MLQAQTCTRYQGAHPKFGRRRPAAVSPTGLARREGDALVYVGRVGTGWDRKCQSASKFDPQPLMVDSFRRPF